MLSFAAPIWLSGLLLLPVIRWLHRGGRRPRAVPVSRVELWQQSAASSPMAGRRAPPDPAWRRRALLAALFFVALSGPQLPEQRSPITLWIDDSLSMLTREAHGTRLAEGLGQARTLLAGASAAVDVRTLSDPWRSLGTLADASIATIVAAAGRKAPAAPPEALLRGGNPNWLVTDGAHPALLDWPGGRRPDRVVQVAAVTRNVGLERLAARRSLDDPDRYDVLLKVANGGTEAETRSVVFATDAGEVGHSSHHVDAGASVLVTASIPASARVRATLQPGDALPEDDEIALDLRPLRRRQVVIDPKCPAALAAAVAAHPALAVANPDAGNVDAVLDCGMRGAGRDIPTIRVLADRPAAQPAGAIQWSAAVPESRRVRLDAERMQVAARLDARPEDDVLLAVGGAPLVVRRAGAPELLETSLDFGSAAIARGPDIPLLVNLMFETILGSRLLDEVALADRGAGSASVAPVVRAGAGDDARVPADVRSFRDSQRAFVVAALLVLVWELVALGRQWHRSAEPAGAQSK